VRAPTAFKEVRFAVGPGMCCGMVGVLVGSRSSVEGGAPQADQVVVQGHKRIARKHGGLVEYQDVQGPDPQRCSS